MRFEPLEAAIALAALGVFAAGLSVSTSETRTADRLMDHGRCVYAEVEKAGSFNSLRLGRFADITYAVGGARYHAELHYDSDRPLLRHTTVRICTDPADPRTFAMSTIAVTGDSTGLWLRGVIGDPLLAIGAIVFVLVIAKHEWFFHD